MATKTVPLWCTKCHEQWEFMLKEEKEDAEIAKVEGTALCCKDGVLTTVPPGGQGQ